MSDMIRITGKTVEDAITEATIRFGVTSDKIVYNVIEHESKGFLGLRQHDAVIEVRVKTEADFEAERIKENAEKMFSEEEKKEIDEIAAKELAEELEKAIEDSTAASMEETAAPAAIIEKDEETAEETAEAAAEEKQAPKRLREIKPLENPEEAIAKAESFLTDVYKAMGMDVKLESTYDGEILNVQMTGDDMGILIGKRGQTLDALQYLVSLAVNKGSATYVRVKIDTENYRERRKATLENLAKNISVKVKKTRQPVYLEPMNPYERRAIHSALQDDPFVTTHSEGEEPDRKVVITLKADADLSALDRKYGERRGRGGRNFKGGRGRSDRRGGGRRRDDRRSTKEPVIKPVRIPDAPKED